MKADRDYDFLVRPAAVPQDRSGVLIAVTPEEAGWDTIGFSVRRLAAGDVWQERAEDNEAAIVVLGGRMSIDWGAGPQSIGRRENVFSGYPYCVYLPCGTPFAVRAETVVELAVSRVRSQMKGKPLLLAPADLGCEIRGGGDTSRQVVRILRPEHEADRLMINEIYTPGGNWSSYPPHKHDTHNPPHEFDLDEIYYFRMDHPDGYALLRLYDDAGIRDVTIAVHDGDLVLLREGYHLVAAPPGYRVYYMAVLAGSTRSLAASTDPRYAHLGKAWPLTDPRIPLVNRD
jgi:5-deoxy-glucuronate isomerase